ncbi:MAG: DUF1016 family protein, partial [Legionella sp.]|nr:DUF1016 family protein [Legionella sp.]
KNATLGWCEMINGITGLTALERLEPCAGKLACTVLRGANNSNVVGLLDFALYGTRYPINVSGKRFEIDLLMYNTKLHVYVVVELKRGDFNPKDTGQLNFYLSAIDEQLKMPEDGPTIGLLLCEKKDKVIAEYSLRRVNSPMGIAEYEVSKSLSEELNSILPTTEEIETELSAYTQHLSISGDENDR